MILLIQLLILVTAADRARGPGQAQRSHDDGMGLYLPTLFDDLMTALS
jgi:hypothetical protein